MYDTAAQRWTQVDPLNQVADLQQANRFIYAGQDPINGTDSAGTDFLGIGKAYHKTKKFLGPKVTKFISGCAAGGATTALITGAAGGFYVPGYDVVGVGLAGLGGCLIGGGANAEDLPNPVRTR
jgi:hypothetical protein